jgi:hypothetical protein
MFSDLGVDEASARFIYSSYADSLAAKPRSRRALFHTVYRRRSVRVFCVGDLANLISFPLESEGARNRRAAVRCWERLGGPRKYYEREAV